jgi:MFS family permease
VCAGRLIAIDDLGADGRDHLGLSTGIGGVTAFGLSPALDCISIITQEERPEAARSAVIRLAIARGISDAGNSAAFTALTVAVFQTTGSSTWISFTLLATFGVRGLVSLIAGSMGDRFDRKRLMIVCDLIAATVFGAMAFVDAPAGLVALAFVAAVGEPPSEATSAAAIPTLVGEERLGWANGLVSAGRNLGYTLGPVAGGAAAAAFGARWVFAANAVSFVPSALLVAGIPARFSAASDRSATSLSGLRVGLRTVVRDRVLRLLSLADGILVVGMGIVLVADLPLSTELGRGAFGYGVMYSAWGVGLVIGSFAGRWMTERTEPFWLLAGAVVLAAEGYAVAVVPWFWAIVALILVAGVGDALWLIATLGTRQRRTPDAMRSRVLAVSDGIIYLAFVPGFLLASPVLGAIGPRGAYAAFAVIATAAALALVPVWRWARQAT